MDGQELRLLDPTSAKTTMRVPAGGATVTAQLTRLGTDLALNKPTTAFAYVNETERPAFAVDGSLTTKWCSTTVGNNWLYVDLGQEQEIDKWVVRHAGAGGENTSLYWNTMNFRLEVSNDAQNWTTVDTVKDNTKDVTASTVPQPVKARYARVYIIDPVTSDFGTHIRIYSIELYSAKSLDSVNLTADKTVVKSIGDSAKLTFDGKLFNGDAADLTSATVQYKSSNVNVATVDANGVVTPVALGTANVTANVTLNGVTKTSNAVQINVVKLDKASITVDNTTIDRTKTAKITAQAQLTNGDAVDMTSASVQYVSTSPEIASVDSNGVVTGNKVGKAEVSAIVTLNGVAVQTNSVEVTVNELQMNAIPLEVAYDNSIVEVGENTTITLNAKSADNLYGFDLSFKYDPSLLDLSDIKVKDEFSIGASGIVNDGKGNVRIIGTLKGSSTGISGDVDMVTITFKAKSTDALASFAIVKGTQLSDVNTGLYTLDEDSTSTIAIANSDLTGDGTTKINDLVIVAKAFGDAAQYNASFDMNKDGVIDIVDIAYVAKRVLGE